MERDGGTDGVRGFCCEEWRTMVFDRIGGGECILEFRSGGRLQFVMGVFWEF